MKELKKKILELFKNGLKAKEISEKINVEYATVRNIVKLEQHRILRVKDPQKFRDSANRRYPRFAKKARVRAAKYYEEKKDEISVNTKEDRKKHPGKYRLKRQKEKAKDLEGFKAKKNANWAKNYPKNKSRLSKKWKEDRRNRKQIVVEYYSNGKSNCNCCGYTGLEFLTIDHIVPKREMEKDPKMIELGFKAWRRADALAQWLITKKFPSGFQIFCWNCNAAKGILTRTENVRKCPHQISTKNS